MKIVIIGGGPAGSVAAMELAKKFDVTLIQDKKEFDKPCGGGVKRKVFQEFGLDESLIKHSLDHIYMVYKKDKIKIDLKGENLAIVNRKEFDTYLREKASRNGAKIYYGRFKKIDKNKALIKFKNEIVPFDYDILIAADGVNSTVRKALNLPKIPSTLTHYARTEKYKVNTCEFFFDFPVGGEYYAWAFPHENKTHIGSVDRENFKNLCNKLNIDIKPKGYKIPTWQKNIVIRHNNVYFVGDAAAQVMPLSFEGIYYAMSSAKILAQCIMQNGDYEKEWQKRFLKEFTFMKKLETINKTFLRSLIVKMHKLKVIRNFSVNLWLGEKNV